MVVNEDKTRLLYKVARAYFQDGLTYEQIGKRFGFSRMTVARLLDQAKDEKIVQIIVTPPKILNSDLERKLEERYGLDEAVVITPSGSDERTLVQELGAGAANHLARFLQGSEVISLAWGHTLLAVVEALPRMNWPDIRVVPTTGGLGRPESETYGADLVRRMAEAFGGKPRMIPAPGIISSKLAHKVLLDDPQISEALAMAVQADVAVVGIGRPAPGSILMQSGIITNKELEQLQQRGAVGDIILRFFDADGQPVKHKINSRIIGLDLDQLKQIPRVIGVAGGADKLEVIRAALRGKLIDVLVTDDETTVRLLEEAGE